MDFRNKKTVGEKKYGKPAPIRDSTRRMGVVVGVTGGVGSGKTAFATELARLGARSVDADELAKELVDNDRDIRKRLRTEFGSSTFGAGGHLKRRALAKRVFNDGTAYKVLNRIVWPRLLELLHVRLEGMRHDCPDKLIVLDMAVLFESGAEILVDKTVLITARLDKRIRWLSRARGWTRDDSIAVVRNQMDDAELRRRADFVIENAGTQSNLKRQAGVFYRRMGFSRS